MNIQERRNKDGKISIKVAVFKKVARLLTKMKNRSSRW